MKKLSLLVYLLISILILNYSCSKKTEQIQHFNQPILEICNIPITDDTLQGKNTFLYDIDSSEFYPLVDLNSQYWLALVWVKITPTTITTPYWNQGRTFTTKQVLYDTNILKKFLYHCDRAYFYWRIKFTTDSLEYINFTGDKLIMHTVSNMVRTQNSSTDNVLFSGAGGVAYVSSMFFPDPQIKDAFVFANLFYYYADIISIIIHETGHTVGLNHQKVFDTSCVRIQEYRPNCYMGNSLFPNRGGWIVGPSISCTIFQNDTFLLNNNIGKRYR
jgi:hypothetical protein